MTNVLRHIVRSTIVLAGFAPAAGQAQDVSRIASVRLYPGTAIVERTAGINASTTHFTFSCLPAELDESSVQISASNGAQVGELSVSTKPRGLNDPCENSDMARKIQALQHQKDMLTVRLSALENSRSYLKNITTNTDGKANAAAGATAAALSIMKASEDMGLRQLDAQAQIDALDKTLEPLLEEKKRTEDNAGTVKSISVDVAANGPAELHLTYRVSGPGWTPGYRATLNSKTGGVLIERLAMVAQATGEDWTNARLVLLTGQPGRNAASRDPSTWHVNIMTPATAKYYPAHPAAVMSAPAPMPSLEQVAVSAARVAPLYDVSSFIGDYDVEFDISKPITVPSSGQKISLSLGRYTAAAETYVKVTPVNGTGGFLTAEIDAPDGVWLPGRMDIYRDDSYAGQVYYTPATTKKQSLSFGQDDLVSVRIMPERTNHDTKGFIVPQGERLIEHHYAIENRHTIPVSVHVLESTPVSEDEEIKVDSKFNLNPDEKDWQGIPGVVLWRLGLDAGKRQELIANYKIDYPKDAQITGAGY